MSVLQSISQTPMLENLGGEGAREKDLEVDNGKGITDGSGCHRTGGGASLSALTILFSTIGLGSISSFKECYEWHLHPAHENVQTCLAFYLSVRLLSSFLFLLGPFSPFPIIHCEGKVHIHKKTGELS